MVAATTSKAAHASARQAASIEYGNREWNAPSTQQTDELVVARHSVVEGNSSGKGIAVIEAKECNVNARPGACTGYSTLCETNEPSFALVADAADKKHHRETSNVANAKQVDNNFACTALVAVGLPLIASAGTINIILSDVDVTYAGDQGVGGAIYDVTGLNGGNKNTTEADKVSSAVFEQDMVPIANLMSGGGTDYYADLRIDGVGATVPLAGLNNVGSNAGNFGFDFFSSPGNLAFHLGIDKIDLHLTNGVLFFTGTASNVTSQNLPGGMAFDTSKPIYFSYTATLPGIVGSPATMAVASGAMTISGTMIPEPTTLATLALGLAISSVSCVRRRSRR